MTQQIKLTTNASEDKITSLVSGNSVFAIPFFQRPYKWRSDRLSQFHSDVIDLVDKINDLHFLGAIITHEPKVDPAAPKTIEVIDGQQRITTIFLYICAIVKVLCAVRQYEEAKRLFFGHIVLKRPVQTSNIRLHSCMEDRAQVNAVLQDLLSDEKFLRVLGRFSLQELRPEI